MGRKKAPAPDPRMGEAAARQTQLAEQQWQNYVNVEQPWMRSVVDQSLGMQRDMHDYQLGQMRQHDARYWNTAVPFENRLLSDVNRYDSEEYKKEQVGMAVADMQNQFSGMQGERERGLMRMGMNPFSARAQGDLNAMALDKAEALNSARIKTRMALDQAGLSNKMQLYGGMRGLAGLGATNAGLASGAMGSMTGTAGSMLNANNAAFSSAMGGMSSGISGMGNYTQLRQSAAQINNASNPWQTILGAAAGVGTSALMGKFLK